MSGSGSVEVLAGARGEPESVLEGADPVEAEEAEPSAALGVSADGRLSGPRAWAGLSGLVWFYVPETEASALRLVPAAGFLGGRESGPHLDLAARYVLQAVPGLPNANGGAAEVTAQPGTGLGPHRLEAWIAAEDHRFFVQHDWSFTTAEVGPQWRLDGGGARASARVSGQVNQSTGGTGEQLRARLGAGLSRGGVDLDAAWQLLWATGGSDDDVYRPPYDPVGDPDADADAISAGGFLQHRLDLAAVAATGPWTVAASATGRLRFADGTEWTLHVGLDGARALGRSWSAHATLGTNAWHLGGADLVDPYGWLGLEWSTPPRGGG